MTDEHYVGKGSRGLVIFLIGSLVLGIGMLWFGLAQAQTARTASITFTRPANYTDGSAIASSATVSYRVYQGLRGQAKTQVGTITTTATTINTGLAAGSEYCWEVTAVINGVESGRSNEGCKAFAFPTPETVTITVT